MRRRDNRAGFTLVEVMVALAVVTLGLGLVAMSVQTAIYWVKETRNRQVGLHEARAHFEHLRDSGYNLLVVGDYVQATNVVANLPFVTTYNVGMSLVSTNIKILTLDTSWPSAFDSTTSNAVEFVTFVSMPLHF